MLFDKSTEKTPEVKNHQRVNILSIKPIKIQFKPIRFN